MLARKPLAPQFANWNRKWGAPFGRNEAEKSFLHRLFPGKHHEVLSKGMFGFQINNDTRVFEYPWAFFAGQLSPGMRVLEIGGGLSGFQFVLDRSGVNVTNVDPGMESQGWPVSQESMNRLNAAFGTQVKLIKVPIEKANLEQEAFDRAFSVSVLEHFPPAALKAAMEKAHTALKKGGLFVLTVDLFLDLCPFSDQLDNRYGRNVSIKELINPQRFELVHGDKLELFGFEDFDSKRIMAHLPALVLGNIYPVLVQTLILERK